MIRARLKSLLSRRLLVFHFPFREGGSALTFEILSPGLLPAPVNFPMTHNVLAFKHVVAGMLSRCQTRMIYQNSNPRPNFQTGENVLIHRDDDAVLLRDLADS